MKKTEAVFFGELRDILKMYTFIESVSGYVLAK